MRLDSLRICKDVLQTFFKRHAILVSDLVSSQSQLKKIETQSFQDHPPLKDMLELFKDVYRDYPKEPLVSLLYKIFRYTRL